MFNKNDKEYYNISSIMIYDPPLSYNSIQEQIPALYLSKILGPTNRPQCDFLETHP
jgi:hypothetical protein